MPETFKFVNNTLTTAAVTTQNLYTSPANTTSIIFMGQLANIDPSNTAAVSVTAVDTSGTSTKYLANTIEVVFAGEVYRFCDVIAAVVSVAFTNLNVSGIFYSN